MSCSSPILKKKKNPHKTSLFYGLDFNGKHIKLFMTMSLS
uniref:Uncharacterized protein n=1 Tax=Rhizophora mucronata TaxID=61149 RepID=A0A2P2P943_RHIMU